MTQLLFILDNRFNLVALNTLLRRFIGLDSHNVSNNRVFTREPKWREFDGTTRLASYICDLRSTDTAQSRCLVVIRPLVLGHSHVGFIGLVTPVSRPVAGVPMPASIHQTAEFPTLSVEINGVMGNHVQALYDILGPMTDLSDPDLCTDIAALTDSLSPVADIPSVTKALSGYWNNLPVCDDVDCETLNTLIALGDSQVHFIASDTVPGSGILRRRQDVIDWVRQKASVLEAVDFHTYGEAPRVDAHLDHDPDVWIYYLYLGIPCWLMSRPWNTHVPATFRVNSVSEFIREAGADSKMQAVEEMSFQTTF